MTGTAGEPRLRRLALVLLAPMLLAGAAVAATLTVAAATGGERATAAGPLDLADVSDDIAAHYAAARQLADVYEEVPCYCGCEEFLAHRDLLDCFVRADGAGWDAHAARCGVCIAESTAVRELADSGHGTDAIVRFVIDRFGTTTVTAPPT